MPDRGRCAARAWACEGPIPHNDQGGHISRYLVECCDIKKEGRHAYRTAVCWLYSHTFTQF